MAVVVRIGWIGRICKQIHVLFGVLFGVFASVGSKGVWKAQCKIQQEASKRSAQSAHTAQLLFGQQLGARSGAWLITGDDWKDTMCQQRLF